MWIMVAWHESWAATLAISYAFWIAWTRHPPLAMQEGDPFVNNYVKLRHVSWRLTYVYWLPFGRWPMHGRERLGVREGICGCLASWIFINLLQIKETRYVLAIWWAHCMMISIWLGGNCRIWTYPSSIQHQNVQHLVHL